MAKNKLNIAALKAAGEEAYLQPNKTNLSSIATAVGGEILKEISVFDIENNPMQPRISIDDDKLKELSESIKEDGLITPISVFQKVNGGYILKAGQRRWMAHKLLGLEKIKAVISTDILDSDQDQGRIFFEIAMSENIHRADLDPLEMALSISDAIKKGYYKNAESAAKGIKKSKSFISKLMKVLKLHNDIIRDLERNKSTSDIEALYLIQRIMPAQKQLQVYYDFVQGKIDRAGLRGMLNKKSLTAKHFYERNEKQFILDLKQITEDKRDKVNKLLDQLEKILTQ
jgi:ParB family chromosome partitioning protein